MTSSRLIAAALAAAVSAAAMATGSHLVGPGAYDATGLAMAGALASLAFVGWAIAGALLIEAPPHRTLALGMPRAGSPRLGRVVAGQLGYGILVSVALSSAGVVEGSSIAEMDQAMGAAVGPGIALLALGVALAPGISEELLFRGLLLGVLLPRFGAALAIVLSTLPFALVHIDPAHIVGAGLLGLYLAAARVSTGSTLVSIACHVANNAMAIVLSTQQWPLWLDRLALLSAVVVAILGVWEMLRRWPTASVAADSVAG